MDDIPQTDGPPDRKIPSGNGHIIQPDEAPIVITSDEESRDNCDSEGDNYPIFKSQDEEENSTQEATGSENVSLFESLDGMQNSFQEAPYSENEPIFPENAMSDGEQEFQNDHDDDGDDEINNELNDSAETLGAENEESTYTTADDEEPMDSSVVNESVDQSQSMDVSIGSAGDETPGVEGFGDTSQVLESEEGNHDSSLDESSQHETTESSLEEFDKTPDEIEESVEQDSTSSDASRESEGEGEEEENSEEWDGQGNGLEQAEGGEENSNEEMEGVDDTSLDVNAEGVNENNIPREALDDESIQSSLDDLNEEREKHPESSDQLTVALDNTKQEVITVDIHHDSDWCDPPSDFYDTADEDPSFLDSGAEVTCSESGTSVCSLKDTDMSDHEGLSKVVKSMVNSLAFRAVDKVEYNRESVKRMKGKKAPVSAKKAVPRRSLTSRRNAKPVKVKIEEPEGIEYLDEGATPSRPGKKPQSSPKSSPAANKSEDNDSPRTRQMKEECVQRPYKVMVF